jgi:hypothetical protein
MCCAGFSKKIIFTAANAVILHTDVTFYLVTEFRQ